MAVSKVTIKYNSFAYILTLGGSTLSPLYQAEQAKHAKNDLDYDTSIHQSFDDDLDLNPEGNNNMMQTANDVMNKSDHLYEVYFNNQDPRSKLSGAYARELNPFRELQIYDSLGQDVVTKDIHSYPMGIARNTYYCDVVDTYNLMFPSNWMRHRYYFREYDPRWDQRK